MGEQQTDIPHKENIKDTGRKVTKPTEGYPVGRKDRGGKNREKTSRPYEKKIEEGERNGGKGRRIDKKKPPHQKTQQPLRAEDERKD